MAGGREEREERDNLDFQDLILLSTNILRQFDARSVLVCLRRNNTLQILIYLFNLVKLECLPRMTKTEVFYSTFSYFLPRVLA